ncbi:MAG: hypothetical protein ACU837_05365 [Gammaproteobacteria bacterium]
MSIIDELRMKANEKKEAQQQEETRAQHLASSYKHALLPKMQQTFTYLNEIVKYLNFVSEPITIKDYSRRYPQLGELLQQNYRINTDGFSGFADFNRLMQINLSFSLRGEGAFSFTIEGSRIIEQEISFLHSRHMPFEWKNITGKNGVKTATFTLQRQIPVRFRVEVLYEQSQLLFMIDNHEDFSKYTKTLDPAEVTEDFLEQLVSYLLRRNHEFTRLHISEQHRQTIRENLELAERERAALIAQIKYEEEITVQKHKKK